MSKQLKISELKRVVNVDKFTKYADVLRESTNEKEIQSILSELEAKTPSRDILIKTRLGFILKELINRDRLSPSVRLHAQRVRVKWKEFHKKLLLAPSYDVKCDKPTTESREKVRSGLSGAFRRAESSMKHQDEDTLKGLAYQLEFGIFQYCDKLVNKRYFTTCRECVRVISNCETAREDYLNGRIDASEFIDKYLKDTSSIKSCMSEEKSDMMDDLVLLN